MTIQINKSNVNERHGELKKYHNKIYIFIGSDSVFDQLLKRGTEPYKVYKKDIIPKVIDEIKTQDPQVYDVIKDVKWSWNRNCGCSVCPCSPGFISSKRELYDVVDIFVTI